MQPLVDVHGAAKLLSVSPWTVRTYARTGKLQGIRLGRLVRFDMTEIQSFIDAAKANNGGTNDLTTGGVR